MDIGASVFIVAAVAGATEFIKRVFARDAMAATIIAVSALIGALAGWASIAGLDITWDQGLIAGLSASGFITGLQKAGQGTNVTSDSIVARSRR